MLSIEFLSYVFVEVGVFDEPLVEAMQGGGGQTQEQKRLPLLGVNTTARKEHKSKNNKLCCVCNTCTVHTICDPFCKIDHITQNKQLRDGKKSAITLFFYFIFLRSTNLCTTLAFL